MIESEQLTIFNMLFIIPRAKVAIHTSSPTIWLFSISPSRFTQNIHLCGPNPLWGIIPSARASSPNIPTYAGKILIELSDN
jgi:hypothetical protein